MDHENKMWVVTADMGYGHQRVAHTFKNYAKGGVIAVGSDESTSEEEKKIWKKFLFAYEFISRCYSLPIVGKSIFGLMNVLLKIKPLDPFRDLSKPILQNKLLYRNIKKGLCEGVIHKVKSADLPFLTTFYATAIAADIHGINPVYCIVCDTDINRVWVPISPDKSDIVFFAPCENTVQRLKMYGVPNDKIHLTGLPLPDELVGGREHKTIKTDMAVRLKLLYPKNQFERNNKNIFKELKLDNNINTSNRLLTITYAIGGAGALKEIGKQIIYSLKEKLLKVAPLFKTMEHFDPYILGTEEEKENFMKVMTKQFTRKLHKNAFRFFKEKIVFFKSQRKAN